MTAPSIVGREKGVTVRGRETGYLFVRGAGEILCSSNRKFVRLSRIPAVTIASSKRSLLQ